MVRVALKQSWEMPQVEDYEESDCHDWDLGCCLQAKHD
ncbi:hypothetical protein M7I_7366 [Glarea lozoyensis 74030]|uniref:Uncharacterized protein n=1 Tax=Glarea lozoyensis (strain ATCC 74030 / MF5533) TaxID=1104152 RepID=H0EX41_GLAL7|nr:hypothetical protein M7I_7366 [Glarea lozoyensis 74030]